MARRSTDFFQRALGYGAVSYGFGFLVVMTHTWRLGLPLIALLDPVYVWLGLPFAAVAFWSIPIVTSVRQRAVEARAGVAEAFRVDPTTPPSVKGLAETLARSVPILPLSGWSQRVASWNLFLYQWSLTAIVKRGSPASLPDVWLQALISATAGITRLFRTLLYVGVLVLMLYLYAWYLYPLMPKSLGGGAPATIRLIVTADDIPLPLLSELGVQSPEIPRQSVTTAPLSLLYSTSDTLFVRTPADRVVSIASSTVNAILWKETGVPLVDTGATTSRASVLMSVHFDVNRTTVAPAVEPLLREAAARVAQEAGRCVQLEGHADADGTAVYNRELSRLRVEAVQVILERAAMPRERIRVVAYGSTQPRLDVASASAKAQNRRVDVSVLPCATK